MLFHFIPFGEWSENMKIILFEDTGCRFAFLLVSSPPEMEIVEIKQLKDYELMDTIFFFFFPPNFV